MIHLEQQSTNPDQQVDTDNATDQGTPEYYTAEHDMVADLQLETSIISPKQQEVLHDEAIKIKEYVAQRYKYSIQPEALEKIATIEDRVLVMDKETFAAFHASWDQSGDEVGNIQGIAHLYGNLIALSDPSAIWDIMSQEAREDMIRQFNDEQTARNITSYVFALDNLTHEIIHMFQDNSLPRSFLEIATRYYQRQTVTELKYGHAEGDRSNNSVNVYTEAVLKYGDLVHDVYFGKHMEPPRRDEVISDVLNAAKNYPGLIEEEDTEIVANKYAAV